MPFGWKWLIHWHRPDPQEFAVSLTTPLPFRLKLDRLPKGIDNAHIDVLLSPSLIDSAQRLARMAVHSDINKRLGCGWAWAIPPGTKEIEAFQRSYAAVMEAALGEARANTQREPALLAGFAALKFLLVLIGEEIDYVRDEIRHERGRSGQHADKTAQMHTLLAHLAREIPGVHYRVARLLFDQVQHVESGLLRQRRKSLLGRSWPVPRELLFNPILWLPTLWSAEQTLRHYPLVGLDRDHPTEFAEINAALTGLFADQLPDWTQPQLLLEESESDQPISRPRTDQGDLAGFLDVELLLGRTLRDEEYIRGRTSWLDDPTNLHRILRHHGNPHPTSSPSKHRSALFSSHLLKDAQIHFQSLGLLRRIQAAPAVREIVEDSRGQLSPSTILAYLAGDLARRELLSRLSGGYHDPLLQRLDAAKTAIRRLSSSERQRQLAHFMMDFARLRRDLKLAYQAYWLMDQIRLLKAPDHIALARRNHTLHEFLLPEEQPINSHEILGHAILKADLRGSSKITKELRERKLNPATHFSLNFFEPITSLLESFGAKKVFVEGDAVILSLYEHEGLSQDWLALCRAAGLARKILEVVDAQNAQNRKYGLPELELGMGIAWLEEAPAFLYDGEHEIMISSAINRADRLSSCAASLRQTELGRKLPRGIEVVVPVNQGIMQKDSGDHLLRYNVNGIELDPAAFPKLKREVVLHRVTTRFPQYSPNSVFYLGRYPDKSGVMQWLVVREAPVRLWIGGDTSAEESGGRVFYEIVTDPEVLEILKQQLAALRKTPDLANTGTDGR